ncbi:hypothetical protein TNCV_4771351 [Trichonephila clavipes]|nr:hypothetical protein TNCV_4771351 [Trichonephila clavipes]
MKNRSDAGGVISVVFDFWSVLEDTRCSATFLGRIGDVKKAVMRAMLSPRFHHKGPPLGSDDAEGCGGRHEQRTRDSASALI